MVIHGGDADGNEEDGSGNRPLRRNTKRPAERQPRSSHSDHQGEEDEYVDQFRVVKRARCAAVAGGAKSSTKAGVAGGAASSSAADAEGSGEGDRGPPHPCDGTLPCECVRRPSSSAVDLVSVGSRCFRAPLQAVQPFTAPNVG